MLKLKTILFLFYLVVLSISITKAQTNLVPNPSFETYTTCPTSVGEVPLNWLSYGNSPDYYNVCASSSSSPPVGVPSNWVGYQAAYDGNGYIGIATYYSASQREYIGATLTQTLSIGTKYFVSAYISRQDTSSGSVGYACSANNFGFRFSTIAFSYTNSTPVNNFSHVYSTSIIYDTLNWRKISGSFIADSVYKYIAVGNFFNNANTSTSNCIYPSSIAYYYVDKVCVSTDSLLCNINAGITENIYRNFFNVYPNPFSQQLNINLSIHNNPYNIIIYNVFGQEVISKKIVSPNEKIDLSGIESGVLFLKIIINNQELNYKLLKQ